MTPHQNYRAFKQHHHKVGYLALTAFWMLVGGWLVHDFWGERQRTINNMSRLAMQQSHLMSSLFGDTFLATDYVLSDLAGHIERDHSADTASGSFGPLLAQKLSTVPGLMDLMLLDAQCRVVAQAHFNQMRGTKNRLRFCSAAQQTPGQSLHVQYMPSESSANGKPVMVMARVLATPEGRLQAAIMALMELEHAQKWIERLKVDDLDVQAIIDTDGILLARNPARPDMLGKPTTFPIGSLSFTAEANTTSLIGQSPFDGQARIFGISRMDRVPFIVLVGHDMDRTLASWQQRAWQFGVGYGLMIFLSIAFVREHGRTLIQSALMYKMATTDALTGVANRRQLFKQGGRDFARALRYGTPLTVMMLDIDKFKSVNDRWGHSAGDKVIVDMARHMSRQLRAADLGARLGGEEFAVILPDTGLEGGMQLAERIRHAVEASEVSEPEHAEAMRYTVSIGIAELTPAVPSFEMLIQQADQALYIAKKTGRNRICNSSCLPNTHGLVSDTPNA